MAKYVIIDLETTGLDAERGCILELSALVINDQLDQVDSFSSLVEPTQASLMEMTDFVREMHTKNGLLEDICSKTNPPPKVMQVEQEFIKFLNKHNNGSNLNLYLVGNSIPSLDLPYIRQHMPKVLDCVHYRTIDITAVRLGIALMTGIDIDYKKTKGHRGMLDCAECLQEISFIKSKLPGLLEKLK